MALKTETNTRPMARIRAAFRARFGDGECPTFFYEHGQWWATCGTAIWSVVDAEGGESVDGVDFERVC